MAGEMTSRDRESLLKVIRQRERVAKSAAAQRSAELLAAFEKQVATDYMLDDDEMWKSLYLEAATAAREADNRLAERCRELGIPDRYRPKIEQPHWYKRGQQGMRDRVAELRRMAKTRLDALEKAARVEIERQSVELQTRLHAGALESGEALEFLAAMPTIEALMPSPPTVAELERGF